MRFDLGSVFRRTTRSTRARCGAEPLEGRLLFAADDLDTSFDLDGKVTTDFLSMVAQADTVIPVAGNQFLVGARVGGGYGIARFDANGNPDTTFGGGDGIVTGYGAAGLAVAPDGKLLATGTGFGVTRYNADGTLDTAFGAGGPDGDGVASAASDDPFKYGVATTVLGDGKVLVLGTWGSYGARGNSSSAPALARFNPDGTLDATFGPGGFDGDGVLILEGFTDGDGPNPLGPARLLPDGKSVVAWGGGVLRFNADGTRDSSFGGGDGASEVTQALNLPQEIAVAPDGGVLVTGGSVYSAAQPASDAVVVRFTPDGALDASFGPGGDDGDGAATIDFGGVDYGYGIVGAPGGKVVVTGFRSEDAAQTDTRMVAARLNADGTLDASFSPGGFDGDGLAQLALDANEFVRGDAVAVTADGGFIVAGTTSPKAGPTDGFQGSFVVVARLDADGNGLGPFGGTGSDFRASFPALSRARAVLVQPDGKTLVGGTADGVFALARYNGDGSPDDTFGSTGVTGTTGQVLTPFQSAPYQFIDRTGEPGGAEGIHALALLAGGKILAVGSHTDGSLDVAVAARYNADGSLDTTFHPTAPATAPPDVQTGKGKLAVQGRPYALAVLEDGRFVVSTSLGEGITDEDSGTRVARFNADGSADTTFGGGDGVVQLDEIPIAPGLPAIGVTFTRDVVIDRAGRVLVAFTGRREGHVVGVIRLTSDGTLDSGFGGNGAATINVGLDGTFLGHDRLLATSLDVRQDLGVVVGGHFDGSSFLAMFTEPGAPDPSFGGGDGFIAGFPGSVNDVHALTGIFEGRKVLVAGESAGGEFVLARYFPDGSLDDSFGVVITEFGAPSGANALALDNIGRIFVAGFRAGGADGSSPAFAVARFQGERGNEIVPPDDPRRPRATIDSMPSVTRAGATEARFVVRFDDDSGIDVSSLDDRDFVLSSSVGLPVRLLSVDVNTDGTPRAATYVYRPAEGQFTTAHNGNYVLHPQPGEVFDVDGLFVWDTRLANDVFSVNIPTDLPNLLASSAVVRPGARLVSGRRARAKVRLLLTNAGAQPVNDLVRFTPILATGPSLESSSATAAGMTRTLRVRLKANASRRVSIPLGVVPPGLAEGDYHVLVQVDPPNEIDETSKLDNVAATTEKVRVSAAPARPARGRAVVPAVPLAPTAAAPSPDAGVPYPAMMTASVADGLLVSKRRVLEGT